MVLTRSQFAAKNTRDVVQNIIRASLDAPENLNCYLCSLPIKVLRNALALMYLGRGGSGTIYKNILADPMDCNRTKDSAVRKLLEKQPKLSQYLTNGLGSFDRKSLAGYP